VAGRKAGAREGDRTQRPSGGDRRHLRRIRALYNFPCGLHQILKRDELYWPHAQANVLVLVHARPAEDTHVLAQRITAETGLKALTWRDFAFATIGYYVKRTGIPVNFGITVALGFIVGAAVVGQTFYIFVIENLRQFGSLKAMGVANLTILRMVLLQAMVVAGIGYAIGIGLCTLFFEISSRVSINLRGFELPWQVAAGTAGAVFIIIVFASLASVRKVMVVDPAIVFRG
jgi:putative ABC transport system permease protein